MCVCSMCVECVFVWTCVCAQLKTSGGRAWCQAAEALEAGACGGLSGAGACGGLSGAGACGGLSGAGQFVFIL
jgi:hypothetical protein